MNLLLDTHVALWALLDRSRLTPSVSELISSPHNDVHVSVVSIWEIAIKRAVPRRYAPPISAARAVSALREAGYRLLDVTSDHAARVETLPDLHHDPFDRLLVAQALTEPLKLITHDARVAAYSDTIVRF